ATGNGPGTVAYTVAANSATESRSGSLTIGGQSHAFTQQGRSPTICSYEVSPDTATWGHDGGTRTFSVNAPADCAWRAISSASRVIVHAGQGSGTGTVSYAVAPDPDTGERTALITVADRTY